MPRFARGDVVVTPFPFSDASGAKRRPALVLAPLPYLGGMDYLVCLITSQNAGDPHQIVMTPSDIIGGTLAHSSYLRPLYLFAIEENAIIYRIGTLSTSKLEAVTKAATEVLNS